MNLISTTTDQCKKYPHILPKTKPRYIMLRIFSVSSIDLAFINDKDL